MFCAASAVSAPRANAEQEVAALFCPNGGEMWLDPAWTGNYRCDAGDGSSGYNRTAARIYTNERAGCVDYADVWHNVIDSWRCVGSYTQGTISIRQDGGWYRGIIRNNNTSKGGWFHAVIFWKA
jgi:hypothetical protein